MNKVFLLLFLQKKKIFVVLTGGVFLSHVGMQSRMALRLSDLRFVLVGGWFYVFCLDRVR